MIGRVLNQRFSLDKELGRGGMGAVYRATDQRLGRTVAIKVLKELSGEEVGKKIGLEAQILARLLHENVVRLYDFDIADGTYFLVMEEVDGSGFQKRWKKIGIPERIRIVSQVADALDYAHRQGVIHRDVKPANILLTASDQAKLSDFGLSLLAEHSQDSGVTRGTPHYMSPEQARGRRLDHRSDLYALGVILYECATGGTPFHGVGMAVMSQHVSARPEPPRAKNPELSEPFERLILRLLAKNLDDRPGSGQAVASELRELLVDDHWRVAAHVAQVAAPLPDGSSGSVDALPVPETMPHVPAFAPPRSEGPSVAAGPREPTFTTTLPGAAPSLARLMLDVVEADPIVLSPDDRYLCGHYLAYLLGGSRKSGFLRRRRLDPRNADRARLMLAMTYIMVSGAGNDSIALAARLLEDRNDVRPAMNPIVVMKYIASRERGPKRKRFRQARQRLLESSPYAQKALVDARGILNPGLMPQTVDDLSKIAPARTEVDDQLVSRWNRIAEAWRANFEFRMAVLRYATRRAYRDPASFGLWPEVVYPLIERTRWQRQGRSALEAFWDAICGNLRIPDAGLRLDHAMQEAVPMQMAEKLDLAEFVDEPQLAEDMADAQDREADRLSMGDGLDPVSINELASEGQSSARGLVRLVSPDPLRFNLGDLGGLWKEAVTSLRTPGSRVVHRPVPIGPYRLVVIPSVRGRSAGTVAIQGMPNKQIELLTPSLRAVGTATQPIVAVWLYQNNSVVIAYIDFKRNERYIVWDAATAQQSNFDDAGIMNSNLLQIGLEAPDQLDRALTKSFRPRNPV
ncbi:MAG TPA: serine/threonine-protein kinase [Isosphaeraceae bacterium]|nr:serine/threonine-protein kinase [Isosphaeraceae bacterium]